MNLKDEIENIDQEIKGLRARQLRLIGDECAETLLPQMRAMVGRAFIMRDGAAPRQRAIKVLAVTVRGSAVAVISQECLVHSHGAAEIRHRVEYFYMRGEHVFPPANAESCDNAEYEALVAEAQAELAEPALLMAHLIESEAADSLAAKTIYED